MALIKGERIVRSEKLRRVSRDAYLAYSFVMATSGQDDFGRFHCSARVMLGRLAPERPDITEDDLRRWLEEYKRESLIRTYECDGLTLGEWSNYMGSTDPRFHRFPDPPWSTHEHSTRCAESSARVARVWRAESALDAGSTASVPHAVLPPSVPIEHPPIPPSPSEGGSRSKRADLEGNVEAAIAHWMALGGHPMRRDRRMLRDRFRAGLSLEVVKRSIEELVRREAGRQTDAPLPAEQAREAKRQLMEEYGRGAAAGPRAPPEPSA